MKILPLGEKCSVRGDIQRDGRHLKVTPILRKSWEDLDFLTDRGADITLLSVSSKIYTRVPLAATKLFLPKILKILFLAISLISLPPHKVI